MITLEEVQLFKWLQKKNPQLAARVQTIRQQASVWLGSVPVLFAHYTNHSIAHCDRVAHQVSRLLFDEGKNKPKLRSFSPAEAYCLLVSIYLHDIGMVVPPGEIREIMKSAAWVEFLAQASSSTSLESIPAVESNINAANPSSEHEYINGLKQTRLIAEFVRRQHHARIPATLRLSDHWRDCIDADDPIVLQTIAAICEGHGLESQDLKNDDRYPEEATVFGQSVNVRFLARLLRIGDLLDLDHERGSDLLKAAVTPLPPESEPHWRQFKCKKHEVVRPDRIELKFECPDQFVHRLLADWLRWLEKELAETQIEQAHALRHSDWRSPKFKVAHLASHDEVARKDATAVVKPERGATYRFHEWRLELDTEKVLHRLIHDIYESPMVVVRELVQNAVDATRCQMFRDFERMYPEAQVPPCPTDLPESFRNQYPVKVSLKKCHDQEELIVEDLGTGMTEEIVRRFFLQVGRSYYQSTEFRGAHRFTPSSRFGVGFLSVFAVSDDILVDTFCHSDAGRKGIRMHLTEPSAFLATETLKGRQEYYGLDKSGTRVRIKMRAPFVGDSLVQIIRHWCVTVEVPVIVEVDGTTTIVSQTNLADGAIFQAGREADIGEFTLRVFSFNAAGVRGSFGVFAYRKEASSEAWCDRWDSGRGLTGESRIQLPDEHCNNICFHGINTAEYRGDEWIRSLGGSGQWTWICDVRSPLASVPLSRTVMPNSGSPTRRASKGSGHHSVVTLAFQELHLAVQREVERHFAVSPRSKGWEGVSYIADVLSNAPVSDEWRTSYPGSVAIHNGTEFTAISVRDLLRLRSFVLCMKLNRDESSSFLRSKLKRPAQIHFGVGDIPRFARSDFKERVREYGRVVGASIEGGIVYVSFELSATPLVRDAIIDHGVWYCDLPAGIRLLYPSVETEVPFSILSSSDPSYDWLVRIANEAEEASEFLSRDEAISIMKRAAWLGTDFDRLLRRWREDSTVPEGLRPGAAASDVNYNWRVMEKMRANSVFRI